MSSTEVSWAVTDTTAMRSVRWGLSEDAAKAVLAEMDQGDGRLAVTSQKWNGMCGFIGGSTEYAEYEKQRQGEA
jgi:hypothetical protein